MTMVKKILVIRGGAIGDFLLTLPVLAALRKHFPKATLDILGYPHVASLAAQGGLAETVYPIEAPQLAGFFVRGAALNPEWVRRFAEVDLIVSFAYDPEGIFEANVRSCTGARILTSSSRP